MSQKLFSKEYIKKIADILIRDLGLSCPYNPKKVIEMTSGTLEREELEADIDAYIIPRNSSYKIVLNKYRPIQWERFTLAHELGHLFLHYGFLTDDEKWKQEVANPKEYYRSNATGSRQESEANEFAACFLMPEDEFVEQVLKNMYNDLIDIEAVANVFDVSVLAAQARAKWLGLINW